MEPTFKITVVAKLKHGVLYEAIKKRGWTLKQAAEFLDVAVNTLCGILSLRKRPPFISALSRKRLAKNPKFQKKAKAFEEKLMELTNKTVEELFPEEFQTDEFLARSKTVEASAEVPTRLLLEQINILALPAPPDEIVMEQEEMEELQSLLAELPEDERQAIERWYLDGQSASELGQKESITAQAIYARAEEGILRMRQSHRLRERLIALRAKTR